MTRARGLPRTVVAPGPGAAAAAATRGAGDGGSGALRFTAELHKVLMVDCRPRANAVANMAKGGGTESSKHYRDAELVFLKIDNIHGVRKAYQRLRNLVRTVSCP